MEYETSYFTNRPPFELVDREEVVAIQMSHFEKILNQTIGARTTHADITRVLQQKILISRDNVEILSFGILNTLLTTNNNVKFQQFFQVLQLITQDSFESILTKLESIVYLKFQALKPEATINLLKIVQSFIKIKLARIETLIILCLRQIIAEDFSEKTQNYSRLLLNLLQEENEWIVTNIKDIALIFAKLLRIFAFSLSAETSEYKAATHKLIFIIWQKRKNDCITLGRELIRLMMDSFKCKELEFITNDLRLPYENFDHLSEYLLKNQGPVLNLQEINKMLIPPYLDEMLQYLHQFIPGQSMSHFMRWVIRDFKIQPNSVSEFLWADIARFVIVGINVQPEHLVLSGTPRWRTLKYILETQKNNLARSFIKQNIFYDWMFYKSGIDSVLLIEPGISLIKGTFVENIELCHELLDFLFIMCKEYNPKNIVETKNSIRAAFGDALRFGITKTFDDLIYSEKLDYSLKEKISSFIPSEKTFEMAQISSQEQQMMPSDQFSDLIKPTQIQTEEYNPFDFDDFTPFSFETNFDDKLNTMPEYDPDSAYTNFYNEANNKTKDNGIMEIESTEDKSIDFETKFKSHLQKIKESPNSENFEAFLKEFLQSVHYSSNDDIKYLQFATALSDCYESHFEDVLLESEGNIIKVLLKHTVEALHTNILRNIFKVRDTISFQYLIFYYKIINNKEKAFLEDYVTLIGGERNFEVQFPEDIIRLYSIYPQTEFNELLLKIVKDFSIFIIGKGSVIKCIIEIGDSSLYFWLEEELICSTIRLFPEKVKDLIFDSITWSHNSQESLWELLTNQFNLSKNKEVLNFIINTRDLLNEQIKDLHFDVNRLFGLLKGFKRFFTDSLRIKEDKTKFEYLVSLIDLDQKFSFYLHSLLNLLEAEVVRASLKEYIKRNGEDYDKIRNFGYHALYVKTNKSYRKIEQIFAENHTKSLLTKFFQKHKLEKDFKDFIEQ